MSPRATCVVLAWHSFSVATVCILFGRLQVCIHTDFWQTSAEDLRHPLCRFPLRLSCVHANCVSLWYKGKCKGKYKKYRNNLCLFTCQHIPLCRHSSDAALTADAEDDNRVSTAASSTEHSDDEAEHTASPEEVQRSSNAAMSANAPDEVSGSTGLAASEAEASGTVPAMPADTLPQGPVWSSADAATVDRLLSSLVAEAVSQAGMSADCHSIIVDAANGGAADAQTRSADGGPYDTQTPAVYHSAAFEGAAMSVELKGEDSVDVEEMNGSALSSEIAHDQSAEGNASVQGLQADDGAPDSKHHVAAGT